jgi:hypothetical protein
VIFVHEADMTRCSRYHRRANCITGKDRQYVYLGPDENRELCTALESPTTIGRAVVTQQNTVEHNTLKYVAKPKLERGSSLQVNPIA